MDIQSLIKGLNLTYMGFNIIESPLLDEITVQYKFPKSKKKRIKKKWKLKEENYRKENRIIMFDSNIVMNHKSMVVFKEAIR